MLAENTSNSSPSLTDLQPIELVIENAATAVDSAGKWLAQHADELDLSDRILFGLELVLEEALTNIISYAYKDDGKHQIFVRVWRSGANIWLQTDDDGIAFNPLEDTRPPAQASNLKEAEIGNMGIHLIRGYMDECQYLRENDRNLLTLGIADNE